MIKIQHSENYINGQLVTSYYTVKKEADSFGGYGSYMPTQSMCLDKKDMKDLLEEIKKINL